MWFLSLSNWHPMWFISLSTWHPMWFISLSNWHPIHFTIQLTSPVLHFTIQLTSHVIDFTIQLTSHVIHFTIQSHLFCTVRNSEVSSKLPLINRFPSFKRLENLLLVEDPLELGIQTWSGNAPQLIDSWALVKVVSALSSPISSKPTSSAPLGRWKLSVPWRGLWNRDDYTI